MFESGGSDRSEYFVVFNPMASRGDAAGFRGSIESAFRDVGAKAHLVATTARGHAIELAQQAVAEGWPAVVAVGGDGIVHEVANGLMRAAGDAPTLPMGIVPVGSGNDFVKRLEIPCHQPAAAVRKLVAASPRGVDIGRVTHTVGAGAPPGVWYFTNGIGLGFDARVAQHASRIRRLRGFMIYAWGVAKTLADLSSPKIRVVVDGREVADRELIITTISNGPCHGGNFWITPEARIDDGVFDILIADGRSLPGLLALLPLVPFGRHIGQKGVELFRGARVEVQSGTQLPIHADGELIAEWVRELVIEVAAGQLTVLA
ncbi:MAG: diacylglycerol kinase family lipid kinase [Gemmatimonadota bacterium]|jgi:YegS/Rv2252/BmrU family lipid kinase|nr:diacylglycerol kinase family lipid kinase [Gemmatimonadota bacterium]